MAEYIEREALLRRLIFENGNRIPEVNVDNFPTTVTIRDVKKLIRDIPAADVAPVVHGRWMKRDGYTECSKCEYWYDSAESDDAGDRANYCPNCGAKMQEVR